MNIRLELNRFTKRDVRFDNVENALVELPTYTLNRSVYNIPIQTLAIHKLGKYEDADEKLGVSYIILMIVKKSGFYIKGYPTKQEALEIDLINECIYYGDREVIYFKDYGKTWAVNKEDFARRPKFEFEVVNGNDAVKIYEEMKKETE